MKSVTAIQLVSMLLAAPLGINAYKVEVMKVENAKFQNENTITYREPGKPGRVTWGCDPNDGDHLALSADQTYATCCNKPNSVLAGSAATEFHCCSAGEDVALDAEGAYGCCPAGQIFGGACKELCKNGKEFDADGNCVCPKGEEVQPDGNCGVTRKPDVDNGDKPACKSGLETGKCYQFKGKESGKLLAYVNNQYSETARAKNVFPGKFLFCLDETCKAGIPVNPSNQIYIKDLHGPTRAQTGQWLDGAVNGAHIGKTPEFAKAGSFSISKWTCGTYCLSGFIHGLDIACPTTDPSISFYTNGDAEACVPFELIEVPCDIRDDANNCLWDLPAKKC
ncbi:hypothetical protein MCOR27_003903 [Pyricularia oryzae]|uniref:Cystein rich protein n=1 Tax=Pyricularia grisea TaxID=148305 RepID=A0ABQ8N4N8_PYRGI|nr:hypothetical protein MCOR01_003928 [Pyricularia oryzae]KAI6290867.1 hypothetical protein MCOR33_011003 [Pyricularia grisea]KAH9430553.1 hypothetical protein MCOR02_007888 [Pyricularia oryzae]KAI6258092.1 hypothetical protein MCOR19_005542 [Pyricularia oryzae]KAI6274308.1 hypothetical protein MCOR26_006551 [Pyricularia oryzae]